VARRARRIGLALAGAHWVAILLPFMRCAPLAPGDVKLLAGLGAILGPASAGLRGDLRPLAAA